MENGQPSFKYVIGIILLAFGAVYLIACPGKTGVAVLPTDSTTPTEIAEALVSGTVNATSASGTPAMNFRQPKPLLEQIWDQINPMPRAEAQRLATAVCPTVQAGGTGCSVVGNQMALPLPICDYPNQPAAVTWSGNMFLNYGGGSTSIVCGSFPAFQSGDVISRIFSGGTSRMTANSLVVLLDTTFDTLGSNPPVTAIGISITFTGPVSRNIVIGGIHVAADINNYTVWDYVVSSGTIAVDGTNTVDSGTLTLQNLLSTQVATAQITAPLTYTAGYCTPATGTVTTTFNDGTPTQTMVFTGSGTATLNGTSMTLTHCF